VDLSWPLTTLCPHTEYRLLSVLAAAEAPLGGNELSRRAGMAQGGGRGALDRLVAAGLVARTWASPNLILFALNREHLAVDVLMDLASAVDTLADRILAHVTAWDPPATSVALRLPCPERVDAHGGQLIDLLLVTDAAGDASIWAERADELAARLWRWSGNETHPHLLAPGELAGAAAADGELAAAAWLLVAGSRPGPLALVDDVVPSGATAVPVDP
jgi:hypothetical protein